MLESQVKNQIIETAREQFLMFGFSKVTTKEIAASLGMSKKTLYKYFPSKEELLQAIMQSTMDEIRTGIEEILNDEQQEFIWKLKRSFLFLGDRMNKLFSRPLLRDIHRKSPQMWKQVVEFREKMILSKFSGLISEGVESGVFRQDVKQQILVRIYLSAIQSLINPEMLSQIPFTAKEVFEEIVSTLFSGILTDSARRKFMEY